MSGPRVVVFAPFFSFFFLFVAFSFSSPLFLGFII